MRYWWDALPAGLRVWLHETATRAAAWALQQVADFMLANRESLVAGLLTVLLVLLVDSARNRLLAFAWWLVGAARTLFIWSLRWLIVGGLGVAAYPFIAQGVTALFAQVQDKRMDHLL